MLNHPFKRLLPASALIAIVLLITSTLLVCGYLLVSLQMLLDSLVWNAERVTMQPVQCFKS